MAFSRVPCCIGSTLLWFCSCLSQGSAAWVEPRVFMKANASLALPGEAAGCQVLFLRSFEDANLPSGELLDIARFDAVLTDATDLVPWAAAKPPLHYIDVGAWPNVPHRELLQKKQQQRSLSVLVPSTPTNEFIARWTAEAEIVMQGDVFYDDGSPASRRQAFENYAYSVLLSLEEKIPPDALVECIAYGTVPLLVWTIDHFLKYTVHLPYAIGKFRPEHFSPAFAKEFVQSAHTDLIHVNQNSVMLSQDFFEMRYSIPFPHRLRQHAARLCEDAVQPPTFKVHVFTAIYSAKRHFASRQAARDTWLRFLADPITGARRPGQLEESIVVAYRFFTNAVGGWDPSGVTSSPIDDPLRAEFEAMGDIVMLDAVEEYPIGNMGRLALHWIANHTSAPYILKLDDDMYIRPLPLFRHLVRQQRAMMYWGFFERSGEVVRDSALAHFLPTDVFGHDGVFPPYARGAALAFSLDLVRLVAHFDRHGVLRRLPVEDASYGYFLWQLILLGVTSVTLADNDEKHFSLDPKCCTEKTHPGNCWSPLSDVTWIVHHVSPQAMLCMFQADVAAGYYAVEASPPASPQQVRRCATIDALHAAFAALASGEASREVGDAFDTKAGCAATGESNVVPVQDARSQYDPARTEPLPALCDCVTTPAAHPDLPHRGRAPAPQRGPLT